MYCPNCKQEYDGKFCPECGTKLIEKPATSGVSLGDANAITGGLHVNDSHAVHNEDKSVHNITNTTSTVNNITQVSAQKTEMELLQEKKALYLTECKRAYEDNVLEQSEVIVLEECRIKLGLDKSTADAILESVRVMSDRNARKSELNPIAKTKLKILTSNLQKNEVKALMDQIDSLEPLVRRFDHDELSRKYYLVLAALKPEKCIEQKERTQTDTYWEAFWCYLAYIKAGRLIDAEETLASLDHFSSYPEDNMTVLAAAGALMMGHTDEAKEYLDAAMGEYTPALQRFVDSIYLLLNPDMAKEMGADGNTCAFYLVNFFGQKDPKAKAEEERLRKEAEAQAKAEAELKKKEEAARKKAEAEQKKKEAAEKKRKAEEAARKKAEEERRRLEAERKKKEEAKRKAEEERLRREREEAERKKKEEKPKCSGTTRDYEDHAKALPGIVKKINEDWNGHAREACILENGMAVVVKDNKNFCCKGINKEDIPVGLHLYYNLLFCIASEHVTHFTFNSKGLFCVIFDSPQNNWSGQQKIWYAGNMSIPEQMEKRLEEYDSRGDTILSVSIADNGDWAVMTNKSFAGTNRAIAAAKKAGELYGDQKSISLTNLGVIVCCERGVYYENIPTNIAENIKEYLNQGWIPAHISFTDSGTCFISNGKEGNANKCTFYM